MNGEACASRFSIRSHSEHRHNRARHAPAGSPHAWLVAVFARFRRVGSFTQHATARRPASRMHSNDIDLDRSGSQCCGGSPGPGPCRNSARRSRRRHRSGQPGSRPHLVPGALRSTVSGTRLGRRWHPPLSGARNLRGSAPGGVYSPYGRAGGAVRGNAHPNPLTPHSELFTRKAASYQQRWSGLRVQST